MVVQTELDGRARWGRIVSALACAGLTSGIAACGAATPPTEPGTVTRVQTPTKAQRPPVIGGEPVARSIDWPRAEAADAGARAALGPRQLEVVDRAPVPALIPSDPQWLDGAVLTDGEHFFALSTSFRGVTLYVQGSDQARVYPHIRGATPTEPVRAGRGYLSQNEGIWTASFIENGAAYTVEVECADAELPACRDVETVRQLSNDLVVAGGRGMEVSP